MKASYQASQGWLCIATTLSLSIAACSDSPSSSVEAESRTSDSAADAGEIVSRVLSNLEAHATDLGDGHLHVDMRHADGQTVFSADFAPVGQTYHVDHTLFIASLDGRVPTSLDDELTFDRDQGETLTVQGAVDSTILLHKNISASEQGDYDASNYYGCDLGPTVGPVASCSTNGGCCDTHDTCYKKYACTADSWRHPLKYPLCETMCNAPAVKCFALEHPGPSTCCKPGANYCGQLEVPGQPAPTTASPAGASLFGGTPSLPTSSATAAKPATTTTAPKPATTTTAPKPATTTTAPKPATTTTAPKPATTSSAAKPTTATTKPSTATMTSKPSSSVDGGVADNSQGDDEQADGGANDCDPNEDPDCQPTDCDPAVDQDCESTQTDECDASTDENCEPQTSDDCDPNAEDCDSSSDDGDQGQDPSQDDGSYDPGTDDSGDFGIDFGGDDGSGGSDSCDYC